MPKKDRPLTGAAGELYVAYMLFRKGYLAALTRQGAPSVDIIASNREGDRTVAIQVKTTEYATRLSGRGVDKHPARLEFPLGAKSATNEQGPPIIAFVDLNPFTGEGSHNPCPKPDVYIVPSKVILKAWKGDNYAFQPGALVRHHRSIVEMEPFKNNWLPIEDFLNRRVQET